MATISDIKSYAIVDENITGNVGDTNLTLVTTDFHQVETLEVVAPAQVAVIDIGVVALGNTGGPETLDTLTDVTITTPSTGQVLKYNGTGWVNDVDATGAGAGSTNLSATESATDVVVASDTGTDATIPSATGTAAGVLSAADKAKLDGIAAGANVNSVTSVAGKTGAVTLTKTDVGLASVDNTSDASKPVSTAQQAALDLKAPLASPAFTGTPTGITKTHVGLGNVDNTSDTAKPVSTAQQTALDGKQALDSDLTAIAALTPTNDDIVQRKAGAWVNRTPAQLKTDLALAKGDVGLGSVDNTADTAKPVSTAQQTALNLKAPLASPAFTGTPTGITKTHVGLANVDNTADTAKPVSTAQQTALDLKAPLASPAFTGTPTGITKTHVGLGNVDNTADSAKPVSTAQQTALDARMVWADGTTSTNARPTTSSKVIWVGGTTQPVNMLTGDLWIKA
jgi:hypothetical protein